MPRANCTSQQVLKLKHIRNTKERKWKKSNREATQSSSLGLQSLSRIISMDLGQAQTTFPAFSSCPAPSRWPPAFRDKTILHLPGLLQFFLEPHVSPSALFSEESKRDPRVSRCLHARTQHAQDLSNQPRAKPSVSVHEIPLGLYIPKQKWRDSKYKTHRDILGKQKYCKDRDLSMWYNLVMEIHKAGIFLFSQVISKS